MVLKLVTGSYLFTSSVSQYFAGTDKSPVEGVYVTNFTIPSSDPTPISGTFKLSDAIASSGSVNFKTYWDSLDGTYCYSTGTLTVKKAPSAQGNFTTRRPSLRFINSNPFYTPRDTVRFRVFGVDLDAQYNTPVKKPRKLQSVVFDKIYYQVIDRMSGKVVIDYDTVNDSTRLSIDSQGMFFDFKVQALPPGRTYAFRFMIVERGSSYLSVEDDTFFDVRN